MPIEIRTPPGIREAYNFMDSEESAKIISNMKASSPIYAWG